MYSEFGALNKWVHIWAYKDAGEALGPSCGLGDRTVAGANPPGVVVKQENAFVMPAYFSPIR